MGALNYYYYRLDKKNNPIPGSNFRAKKNKKERGIVRYIPASTVCCNEGMEGVPVVGVNILKATPKQYYVRVDANNKPIDMSLIISKTSKGKGYQRVYPISCCNNVEGFSITKIEGHPSPGQGIPPTFSFGSVEDSGLIERIEFYNVTKGWHTEVTVPAYTPPTLPDITLNGLLYPTDTGDVMYFVLHTSTSSYRTENITVTVDKVP